MSRALDRLLRSTAPAATILIRLAVGAVFLLRVGAGRWSLDAALRGGRAGRRGAATGVSS
jgi:uncharacterized membrane protein YphA (DoxX/SURF4 family)